MPKSREEVFGFRGAERELSVWVIPIELTAVSQDLQGWTELLLKNTQVAQVPEEELWIGGACLLAISHANVDQAAGLRAGRPRGNSPIRFQLKHCCRPSVDATCQFRGLSPGDASTA